MISILNRLYKRLGTFLLFALLIFPTWGAVLFNDVADLPVLKPVGAIIQTDSNGLWRITRTPTYANYQSREPFYAYLDGTETRFSFTTSGGGFYVEKMASYATERIMPPLNIDPGTVLPASSGNLYKVISGNFYLAVTSIEDVYVYKYSGETWASFKKTGVVVKVELLSGTPLPAPEPAPGCSPPKFDPQANKVFVPCLQIPTGSTTVTFDTEWSLDVDAGSGITLKLQEARPK